MKLRIKRSFGTSLGLSRRNDLGRSCMDKQKNDGFWWFDPAKNKRGIKKKISRHKGSVNHASNIFAYLLYFDKRNQSQKVFFFTFKSRRTQHQQQPYLRHFSTEKAEDRSEWSKGSKHYCAIVNFDSDIPCRRYRFSRHEHVTRKLSKMVMYYVWGFFLRKRPSDVPNDQKMLFADHQVFTSSGNWQVSQGIP